MRFSHKCDVDAQADASFLLDKNSRAPLENYARELHCMNSTELPFSHPGALSQFQDSHVKHQVDKQKELLAAVNLRQFAKITSATMKQGRAFGATVLATHLARSKSGYYTSDTVKGIETIITYLSESTMSGCTFNRQLRDAREKYEKVLRGGMSTEDLKRDPKMLRRDVSGCQYWRGIHGHYLLDVNRFYTMHAANLNTFEEMLTSSCGHFFGNGRNWDAFGWYLQVIA